MSKNFGDTHKKKHIKNRSLSKKELIIPNEDEELAVIINCISSDGRFKIKLCKNNNEYIAKAKGTLIKGPYRQILKQDDLILVIKDSIGNNDDKYFILHKYSNEDKNQLTKSNYLEKNINIENKDDDIEIDLNKI